MASGAALFGEERRHKGIAASGFLAKQSWPAPGYACGGVAHGVGPGADFLPLQPPAEAGRPSQRPRDPHAACSHELRVVKMFSRLC